MSLLRTYPPGSLLKPDREQRKRQKSPAEKRPGKDEAYLRLVRQLPCAICKKAPPSECHHVKQTGERGGAMKSPDKWALPMCRDDHETLEHQGSRNEIAWFQKRGVDPLTLATGLHGMKHSLEAMLRVLQSHIGGR